MKILVDECLPIKVKDILSEFEVSTVRDLKWMGIKNGILINLAFENGFDVFITVDKNLNFQQNIETKDIGLLILDIQKNMIDHIIPLKEMITTAVNKIRPGEIFTLNISYGIKKINKG